MSSLALCPMPVVPAAVCPRHRRILRRISVTAHGGVGAFAAASALLIILGVNAVFGGFESGLMWVLTALAMVASVALVSVLRLATSDVQHSLDFGCDSCGALRK